MTVRDIIKITLNLVVVYLVGGLILVFVYATTSPIMYKNAVIAKEKALKLLIPDADKIEKGGDWTIHGKHAEYFIAKKGNEIAGYLIQSYGKGYSGYINTLIAVDKDFKILKISILSHTETPGLGDVIEADFFKDQFKNKGLQHLKVFKTETADCIEAISGATISCRAVTEDAVKNAVEFLTRTLSKGGSTNNVTGHR